MKYVYKLVVIIALIIWSTYSVLYVSYRSVDINLGRYKHYDVSLSEDSNNEKNTKLAETLYEDYVNSDEILIFKYSSSKDNRSISNLITNKDKELPAKIISNNNVEVLPFSKLKEVKGTTLSIYTNTNNNLDSKYKIVKAPPSGENIFFNSWYGMSGFILLIGLLLMLTLITLLYEENNSYLLRSLMLDGNDDIYIYKYLFSKTHIIISLVTLGFISILMVIFNKFYIIIVFILTLFLICIAIMAIISLKSIYCNYRFKASKMKIINFLFQCIHVMIIIFVIRFIGDIVVLYSVIKPNQDYEQIESKFDDYYSFEQSTTGGETLNYEVKAKLYADYYNFLNENYDTSLAQILPISDSSKVDAQNALVLVNQSYFNLFDIYTPDGRLISKKDFDSDTIYELSTDQTNEMLSSIIQVENYDIKQLQITQNQDAWYADGSMQVYAAHPLVGGTLIVIPDHLSADFIQKYYVFNWINLIMSSSTLLTKGAVGDDLNNQYLKDHGLESTFRDWTSITGNYNNLMQGVYAKISLYQKLIMIGASAICGLALVDILIYVRLNQRKIAIQMLDGNNPLYALKGYLGVSLIKLVIIGYFGVKFLHITLLGIIISELVVIILLAITLVIAIKYISKSTVNIIKKER